MSNCNEVAFQKLTAAEPMLVGCRKMGDVFPEFPANRVLHSGPDVAWAEMKGPHRKGIVGAVLFEKLAKTESEAVGMIEAGEIELRAANDFGSGAPGAGITSRSMAVLVVRERHSGITAVAPPIEGEMGGGLGGWGVYSPDVDANLHRIADFYAPMLSAALEAIGGVNVTELFAQGLTMGDDNHTRQRATDKLFLSLLLRGACEMSCPETDRLAFLRWTNANSDKRFVHHIGCASAVAALKSASGVEGSTLVTALCGNGVEFGVKLSGTGERWHTAPAPTFHGKYWKPEYTDADSSPWLGDSSNVEAWGLGGLAAAAAPMLMQMRDQTLWDGIAQCEEMARICHGASPHFAIPTLPAGFAPAGIRADRVLATGITPKLHGGILSKTSGGQIGVGYARVPLACFQEAMNHVR